MTEEQREIVEGFLAMVLPTPVTICPVEGGWGVLIYGDHPTLENPTGIRERHLLPSIQEAKQWATDRLVAIHGLEVGERIRWELFVCNPAPEN